MCHRVDTEKVSLSVRRAWIEIEISSMDDLEPSRSLSVRRAWIEISEDWLNAGSLSSLSVRRAWIEIDPDGILVFCGPRRSP